MKSMNIDDIRLEIEKIYNSSEDISISSEELRTKLNFTGKTQGWAGLIGRLLNNNIIYKDPTKNKKECYYKLIKTNQLNEENIKKTKINSDKYIILSNKDNEIISILGGDELTNKINLLLNEDHSELNIYKLVETAKLEKKVCRVKI